MKYLLIIAVKLLLLFQANAEKHNYRIIDFRDHASIGINHQGVFKPDTKPSIKEKKYGRSLIWKITDEFSITLFQKSNNYIMESSFGMTLNSNKVDGVSWEWFDKTNTPLVFDKLQGTGKIKISMSENGKLKSIEFLEPAVFRIRKLTSDKSIKPDAIMIIEKGFVVSGP